MEDHMLEEHITPVNNTYYCDACLYASSSKGKFTAHFKRKHGSKNKSTASKIMAILLAVEEHFRKLNEDFNKMA